MAKVSPYVFVLECVIKKHELMYTKNTSFCKLKHEYRKAWSGLSVLDRELYFQKIGLFPKPCGHLHTERLSPDPSCLAKT